jgi:Flp pilus assembly protein TadG
MRTLHRRFGVRSRGGQSLVEFALILPILLILLLGILDFGRAVAAYNSVSNGARSGVRVAIVNQDLPAIEAAVEYEAFGLSDVDVTFDPNVEGVPDCPVTSGPCCPQIGCVVGVTVATEYVPATPIFSQIVGSITVSSDSRMPIEKVAPSP